MTAGSGCSSLAPVIVRRSKSGAKRNSFRDRTRSCALRMLTNGDGAQILGDGGSVHASSICPIESAVYRSRKSHGSSRLRS